MPRIVSLIASATEMVCALGCADQLVGRSHECDFPPAVRDLPHCTEPRFPIHGSSADIHSRVEDILRQALAVYRVDAERLRDMRPEVIITQTHCAVCAVSLADVETAVCTWLEGRPRLVALAPNALADVWADLRRVADALGVPERGEALLAGLQQRLRDVGAVAQVQPHRPTVACIEWIDPLMSAGNWLPELVELAGGVPLFGLAGQHSPRLAWSQLVAEDPDILLVMPCGWDIPKARQELAVLTALPEWAGLRAVQGGQVIVADGNQYFNRPGPRLVETVEILAEVLHPTAFAFGHEGAGWQRW